MSGYMFVIGHCIACKILLTFNPYYVPSITPPGYTTKQPLCPACFKRWNDIHRPNNPLTIHPDAYKEAEA